MINKIRNLDVEVIVHGKVWDEAHEFSLRQAKETNAVYVSPFDDAVVLSVDGFGDFDRNFWLSPKVLFSLISSELTLFLDCVCRNGLDYSIIGTTLI
mgnify:CR=1 FL=1